MADDNEVVYIPECDINSKPFVGKIFKSLVETENFYVEYARLVGFDTRKSCFRVRDGIVFHRAMVCSREGTKFIDVSNGGDSFDSMNNRRKRTSTRCGCKAKIFFKYSRLVGYTVQSFVEGHNHPMVEPRHKHFIKVNRNIDEVHQKFIIDCAKSCIGSTHAYKLMAEFLGGPKTMGCTLVDVRNFSRDLKAFVEGSDTQMLIDAMKQKNDESKSFTYDYQIDEEGRLIRVFWCDRQSRRNYHLFGDIMAFDTTYSTNKYSMIFALFMGKNNHGKPVTFVAGLLSKEDGDSFSWIFEKFINCMSQPPNLIITDQCRGMKFAVEKVLKTTQHRWCMWHIMLKLADKVSKELHANEDFNKELNSCVWSELIEPEVLEREWDNILERYGLTRESWFRDMFNDHDRWVPAYFRDFPMGGLVRTTSISECENSFFKRYTRYRANLIGFWMQYNNALDSQRQNNARLNYINSSSGPTCITKVSFEKHVGSIYTFSIFIKVQEEIISACFNCRMVNMVTVEDIEEYEIEDEFSNLCNVTYDKERCMFVCDCKMFLRVRLICKHIFFIFKNKDIRRIPDIYIVRRWLKQSLVNPVHECLKDEEEPFSGVDDRRLLVNKVTSSFFGWLQKFDGDNDKLGRFLVGMDEMGEAIVGAESPNTEDTRAKVFEELYGQAAPESIEIRPPEPVKTKGSGRRLISNKEKAIRELNKLLRRSKKCMKMARHDSRNCDKVNKQSDEVSR